MSILEYNGGSVLGMAGKNCVAIASDLRFGEKLKTIATNFPKTYRVTDKAYIGLAGLITDAQTVYEKLKFRLNLYELREERQIKPSTMSNLVSHMLYEKRFGPWFVEPIIVGLEGPDNTPFLSGFDLIGCQSVSNNFVVSGTSTEALFGMCESLWVPDMDPEMLFETISQCLLNSVDRDAFAGWGAVVHIITPDKIITRHLKTRQD